MVWKNYAGVKMPYRALFLLKLVICSFYVGASGGVFAQLSENVNECGELERAAGDAMPLSKSERIALRQQEINDLVDQVETLELELELEVLVPI